MNDKISIVENELISVWLYPQRKMIHHRMKTFCHGDRFRDALTKGAEAMEHYKATKWLSDDRGNGAVLAEDGAWGETHWFPRVKAAGWKHWAVVQPAKIIGQMNMARFIKQYAELGINARMFSDPDQAFRWLDGLA
ncbi:MAG TPA: hypothetical protein VFT22_26270 [Kofleriaceae bacterium]|nr:hypothetical protein [Kofleriaceae bacterium]